METAIHETGAQVKKEPLPQIEGDERQLRQLFQNSIPNAIKYRTPETTPEITVRYKKIEQSDDLLKALTDAPVGSYHSIATSDIRRSSGISLTIEEERRSGNPYYGHL